MGGAPSSGSKQKFLDHFDARLRFAVMRGESCCRGCGAMMMLGDKSFLESRLKRCSFNLRWVLDCKIMLNDFDLIYYIYLGLTKLDAANSYGCISSISLAFSFLFSLCLSLAFIYTNSALRLLVIGVVALTWTLG